MSEHELLEELQRLASHVTSSETDLRQKVRQLSKSLIEICQGISVDCSSDDVVFSECEPTQYFVRGHFSFSSGQGISVFSQDSDDCFDAAITRDPYGPSYSSHDIDNVPIEWLQRAITAGKLSELLQKLGQRLEARRSEIAEATELASKCLSNPTLAIGTTFTEVAQQIGYTNVVLDWNSAVNSIATDPANAISRACSLTESVCKHLLDDLGIARPSDQSIRSLFNTTASALGLDPAGQADDELKRICGGLATVAQHLGALRTKFSTAHGRGPADTTLTPAHARLAVNAAGNISTFLMEVRQLSKQSEINL